MNAPPLTQTLRMYVVLRQQLLIGDCEAELARLDFTRDSFIELCSLAPEVVDFELWRLELASQEKK